MEVKKQLDTARARLNQVPEEIENEKDPVEDDLSLDSLIQTTPASLPVLQEPRYLRSDVTAPRVTQRTQQLQDEQKSPSVLQESSSADKTAGIVTAIADSFSLSRLPAPEPTTFSGEPIHYPDWKSSFCALIHRKNVPLCDKMYYLKRYVSGSAKQAISGLFLQSLSDAYEQTWSTLARLALLVLRAKRILQEICRRRVYWVSLCLKTFGQGGSGRNLISCVSRS